VFCNCEKKVLDDNMNEFGIIWLMRIDFRIK